MLKNLNIFTFNLPFYWISADKKCEVQMVLVSKGVDDCLLLIQGVVLVLKLGQFSLVNFGSFHKLLLVEVDMHKVLGPGGGAVLSCSTYCNLLRGLEAIHF